MLFRSLDQHLGTLLQHGAPFHHDYATLNSSAPSHPRHLSNPWLNYTTPGSGHLINVCVRSGPTLTMLIRTPASASIRCTYFFASGGRSS